MRREGNFNIIANLLKFVSGKVVFLSVMLLIGICAALAYIHIFQKPIYTAELSFVLANEKPTSPFGGLANNLGLDIFTGNDNAFSGENIIQLIKSKTILTRALFRPMSTNSLFVNYLGENSGLFKKWRKKERLALQIPFPNEYSMLSPVQDSLYHVMLARLLKKSVSVSRVDKKLNYYTVALTTNSEQFSREFVVSMVEQSGKLYVETKTTLARKNLQMLQREADSLSGILGYTLGSAAAASDRVFNLNPGLQSQRVGIQKDQVRTQVVTSAYIEVVKNLELAKINLQKETPLFTLIDRPAQRLADVRMKPYLVITISTVIFLSFSLFSLAIAFVSKNFKPLIYTLFRNDYSQVN